MNETVCLKCGSVTQVASVTTKKGGEPDRVELFVWCPGCRRYLGEGEREEKK